MVDKEVSDVIKTISKNVVCTVKSENSHTYIKFRVSASGAENSKGAEF